MWQFSLRLRFTEVKSLLLHNLKGNLQIKIMLQHNSVECGESQLKSTFFSLEIPN
jgi:hypothetical protein